MFIEDALIVMEMQMIRFFFEKCVKGAGKICMSCIQGQSKSCRTKFPDKFRSLEVTTVERSKIFHNELYGDLLLKIPQLPDRCVQSGKRSPLGFRFQAESRMDHQFFRACQVCYFRCLS